jgi:signal transduction histidine kinase
MMASMRFASIRLRLTLWYTGVLALVLIAMAGITYSSLVHLSTRAVHDTLEETARNFVATMRIANRGPRGLGPPRPIDLAVAVDRFRFRDAQLLVYGPRGNLLAASREPGGGPRGGEPFTVDPDAAPLRAMVGRRARFVLETEGHAPLAVVSLPLRPGIGGPSVLVVGSMRREQQLLGAVRRALFVGVPLVLILASLGGYFLAGKNLEPVRRAMDQQRQFMADAAHELRTPIAVIRSEADVTLAREERSGPEYRDALGIIADEGRRLTRIVDDLFTLARADAGQYTPRREPIVLAEMLNDVVRSMRHIAGSRGVEIRLAVPDELSISGDEALLRRMITNLLENALKHGSGGIVELRAAQEDGAVRIEVENPGSIPPDVRERVFERFYRGAESRGRHAAESGAGLGLPIARWITEAHGGTLELAPTDASSTTIFRASLPR